MAELITGTVTALYGNHKSHWHSMWNKNDVDPAQTSLWADVTDAAGQTHKVWVGEVKGRRGVPIKRQEEDLVKNTNFLLGREVTFERDKNGFSKLYGACHDTVEEFVKELTYWVNASGEEVWTNRLNYVSK